jgi:hypothetical protein
MRAAYYGGTALTGSGMHMGLFEYYGTDLSDLTAYYSAAGQTLPITPLIYSTDGTSTSCTWADRECDDGEQNLDMTQALGMAPGMATLVMYVGSSDTAIISAMTVTNGTTPYLPATVGCSWGWDPVDPTTLDPYWEKMAAQGQTFTVASGDSGRWTAGEGSWPGDDANIVSVGGTDLTTSSAAGPWKTETAWSSSSGGISPNGIAIPSWQQLTGVINSSNGGSTTLRNGPDVSANANYTFFTCDDQGNDPNNGGKECIGNEYGGTSFAAPMWAAYILLADQQAIANGNPMLGFINPAIYPLGVGSSYTSNFHDITSGKNKKFSAVTGYDLVTGWGSPNGATLITTLTAPILTINPTTGTTATNFVETATYPQYDALDTFYYAVGSATPTSLGTCSTTTTQLNDCTYSFLGSKIGPGIFNMTATVKWEENSTPTYETTTSAAVVLIIQDNTTTTLGANPSSIAPTGSSVITATVVDADTASIIPTGTVTFTDTTNSASLGSCTLSAGTCSVTAQGSSLAAGSNTISGAYGGVTDTFTASSGTTTVTVTAAAADNTSTAVTATPNSISTTGSTTLKATVTDTTNGGNTPTGTVTFTDTTNSASLGSCTLSAGTCSVTGQGSSMAVGSNTISASYGGVANSFNASSGTTTVTVTAAGGGGITFSSVTHNFGTIATGTTGTAYGVEVKNTGSSAYTFALNMTGSSEFTDQTNCGTSIAAGGSCEIVFNFSPTATGAVSATWNLTSEAGFTYSPSDGGTLSGTGVASGGVTLSTAGHNFGDQTVGTTSGTYGTVLTNSTGSAITLTLGSVTSPFAIVTNCGSTLPSGGSCNLDFTFKPTADGLVQQVYSLSANGGATQITVGGNPVTGITLTGTGD